MSDSDDIKIVGLDDFVSQGRTRKLEGKTVVFTSGVFDLVHRGHLSLLRDARRRGDVLLVAINSDESVRRKKGTNRPINPQRERAFLLSQLATVDLVTIFDEPDNQPTGLITRLERDIVVKSSGEWTAGGMLGSEQMKKTGGTTELLEHAEGYSSTNLIQRILERYGRTQ